MSKRKTHKQLIDDLVERGNQPPVKWAVLFRPAAQDKPVFHLSDIFVGTPWDAFSAWCRMREIDPTAEHNPSVRSTPEPHPSFEYRVRDLCVLVRPATADDERSIRRWRCRLFELGEDNLVPDKDRPLSELVIDAAGADEAAEEYCRVMGLSVMEVVPNIPGRRIIGGPEPLRGRCLLDVDAHLAMQHAPGRLDVEGMVRAGIVRDESSPPLSMYRYDHLANHFEVLSEEGLCVCYCWTEDDAKQIVAALNLLGQLRPLLRPAPDVDLDDELDLGERIAALCRAALNME
jgi:hypothetical protein